ncbi:hypothetical protein LTR91_001210 [Friedmanniomyces endolithicus]|uniref:Uncharacterized protein n=1 Tax=Friedmanniomyces endolithicus TaxID=329885 RepID=A0AAN6L0U6_9PEZI|nr:hypothetical protein LTR94_017630 [Friedmanniomyces endolithicus]KAK0794268.1 hypothetical protein LTR59_007914 [Friedmanniomyces endolithicus]KAK0795662.1 hypothetical protein LTR75_010489 [Friedmanniomyces endolithicus]KAK0811179.1 hypothetical protein LTR38_003785 [Friedmanniomyces endolithicus]KAK0839858.1 hypothetical protein LTR03_010944 [Friedmanniomyces endolithicus]
MNTLQAPPIANGRPKREGTIDPRPKKRIRLDDGTHAAIETRCADESTLLEVDILILDYLSYQSISACFASRRPRANLSLAVSLAHSLSMTDTFLALFQHRHDKYTLDAELRFRLLLLKLAALFTQRLTRNPSTPSPASLKRLRETNHARARDWLSTVTTHSLPFVLIDSTTVLPSPEDLERDRAHVLHSLDLPAEDEAYEDAYYGTADSVALLDLLPLFVQVSAARNAMMDPSGLTGAWMRMAAEFMLQAALEQYLVFGARGTEVIEDAFAWGLRAADGQRMEADGEEVDEVDDMFTDAVYETEVEGWADVKKAYLAEMIPPVNEAQAKSSKDTYLLHSSDNNTGVTSPAFHFISRLEMVAEKHPMAAFETKILGFLDALAQSIPEPVLVQLEKGQLDGMSKGNTQEFLRNCGSSVAHLVSATGKLKDFSAEVEE